MILIDEEYPYSIDTETEFFKNNYVDICHEMVIKARESFGKKRWRDGLAILEKVKERTTTERIVSDYISFIEQLYD